MNNLVPAPAIFDAHRRFGLTSYTRDEVIATLDDVETAERECREAFVRVAPYQIVFPDFAEIGSPEAELDDILSSENLPAFDLIGHGGELFPIKRWAATARKFRTLARKADKWLAKYHA